MERHIRTVRRKKKRRVARKDKLDISLILLMVCLLPGFQPTGKIDKHSWNMNWKTGETKREAENFEYMGRNMGTIADTEVIGMEDRVKAANWMEEQTLAVKLRLSRKMRNKKIKSENGNGINSVLKITHWNLGAKFWLRKRIDIEALILEKDPDILFISEANLMEETPDEQRHIRGYKMVLSNTMEMRKYARIVLLIKEDIEFKLLPQFMFTGSASIWIQIGRPGRKPLRIGGMYREQSLLRQNEDPNKSDDPKLQIVRWSQQVAGWKAAAANNSPCIVIGDINLDFLEWTQPHYRVAKMVKETKMDIETLGFSQLISGVTRAWPGQKDSNVDHIWTNAMNRVISHSNVVCAGSDHNVISTIFRMKYKVISRQKILKRVRRNMNSQRMKDLMSTVDWSDLYRSNDVDVINAILEENISSVYDQEAPLRKIQIRKNYINWVDENLKKYDER